MVIRHNRKMSKDSPRAVPEDLFLKGAGVLGEAGREWRRDLPDLVTACVEAWGLSIERPFAGLSYNYVAPVQRRDGTPAVLKLWFPDELDGFGRETEALRLYDGAGAVRLLAVDPERRALLLERAEPGDDLWQLADQGQQIATTAAIMRQLWRAPPPECRLPSASASIDRMAERAPRLAKGDLRMHWIERAKALWQAVQASGGEPVILHGDLHQANILAAQREPWLAIDPHGLVGPCVFDTIQMILNVAWPEKDAARRRRTIAGYVDRLSEHLGLEREAIRACGVVVAVLNGFWALEDHGGGWEPEFAIAEDFAAGM